MKASSVGSFAAVTVWLIFSAGSAVAQTGGGGGGTGSGPLLCNTYSLPNDVIARGEGYTELTGDLVLVCQGGTAPIVGAVIPQVNVTLFFNAAVTSRLLPVAGMSNAI